MDTLQAEDGGDLEVNTDEEDEGWGDMEVKENVITQLLDDGGSSAKKVRFTANSTLAVYPSEKSFSGEESDEDYDEDDDDEEYDEDDDDDDDEEDDDGEEEDNDDDDDEETFSDDEVVINDYRDSIELPFIHSTSSAPSITNPQDFSSTDALSPTSKFNKEALQVQIGSPDLQSESATSTSTTSTNTPTTPPANSPPTNTTNPTEQGGGGSPSQRKWFQQRQGIQRYTPRYSPKASPTHADAPVQSQEPGFSLTPADPSSFPPFVQQLERAKQELHREIVRAKEASDNLTQSSAKLQESVSHLSDRIALSRRLLSALG